MLHRSRSTTIVVASLTFVVLTFSAYAANEPNQVDLLRSDRSAIFSVKESHPESLNNRGSENTRIARIVGPVGSVVTFFDDQNFKPGQNSVLITKTVAEPIEVPIAENFVSGTQHNGIYVGSRPGYNWILNKHVHVTGWDFIENGVEAGVDWIVTHLGDSNSPDQTTVPSTTGETVVAFIEKTRETSNNNHVDNLSSIRFGGESMATMSQALARIAPQSNWQSGGTLR